MTPWAAEQLPTSDNTTLLLALIGVLGLAVTAGGTVLVAWINARGRTAPSPPAPDSSSLGERLAVITAVQDRQADVIDAMQDAEDVQDRRLAVGERRHEGFDDRLERIETWLDRDADGWRQ